MAHDFLGPGFISMSPDFSSAWVVRILVMLMQIAIILYIYIQLLRSHYRKTYVDFERK